MLEVELLAAHERQDASGCADHNVRTAVLQHLLVLLDGQAAEKHTDLDALHVAAEPLVLLADLEGELARVTHHQHVHLVLGGLQLLQRGKDKDCGLTHARLGLAQDVHAKDRLGDALVLNFKRGGNKS